MQEEAQVVEPVYEEVRAARALLDDGQLRDQLELGDESSSHLLGVGVAR